MNVVLYLRYSSDKQTEQSIEGQRRICQEYCKRNDYVIVSEYIDRATSAYHDSDKRPEFQRMIKDSAKKLWQAVIVYKLDRFARNRYVSAMNKVKLKNNGVSLISATENISNSPEGVILESVLEGMAEFYSMELSQKIQRGMNETALKCNSTGGQIPLGYKVENKKLVIDEPAAEIVREAFQLYADGTTVKEIAKTFNENGYKTRKGRPFGANSFFAMFHNEKYNGIYTYNGVRVEGGVPAIVDAETFEIVTRRLEMNKKAPAKAKANVDYLLTQKLFCGHCGGNMVGESGQSRNGSTYYYYTCHNRKRGNCKKKPLPKDYIERIVVQNALNVLTPEKIDKIAEAAAELNRKDRDKDGLVTALEAEIKEADKGIANLVKAIEAGVMSEAITVRLAELQEQKTAAEQRIAEARSDAFEVTKEMIVYWLTGFMNGDIESESFCRQVIDTFVNSVTVWDDPDGGYKISTIYNLTDRPTETVRVDAEGKCSDLSDNVPPLKIYPNTLLFSMVFRCETSHH